MNVFLVYYNFLSEDNIELLSIGGIQNYIYNLCCVIKRIGLNPIVCQKSKKKFVTDYKGIEVHGIGCYKLSQNSFSKKMSNYLKEKIDKDDLIIYCSENIIAEIKHENKLCIQHGVYWDMSSDLMYGQSFGLLKKIKRYLFVYGVVKKINKLSDVIAVDFNLGNVMSAFYGAKNRRISVIPNFTHIKKEYYNYFKHESEEVKIIFARRFNELRGVVLFSDVVERIVQERANISIDFYGAGEYEDFLRQKFANFTRVKILSFAPDDSIKIHSEYHIAVVPSLASEGTSLSLLEAMATGCIPIVSTVGGLTNIVIDDYNGFIVKPTFKDFYEKLSYVCDMPVNRKKEIAINAYNVVNTSFSFDKWRYNWECVIRRYV